MEILQRLTPKENIELLTKRIMKAAQEIKRLNDYLDEIEIVVMGKYEKPQLVKCDIEGWNLADFKTFMSIVKWIQKCAEGLDEFERNRMGRRHESNP